MKTPPRARLWVTNPVGSVAALVASLLLAGLVALLMSWSQPLEALPMYAQRSGRTCANCHESPTLESEDGWDNPELSFRKCTMSCVACHTNPTGGGLRNVSGRYYGQSTLPIMPTQDRSYSDHDDELASNDSIWRFHQKWGVEARVEEEGDRHIPTDWEEVEEGIGAGQRGNWTAIGKPIAHGGKMSFWDGRYDDLNADPMIQVGGDFRAAYWSGTNVAFPMQVDLHGSFQPVEHITFMGTLAGAGRSNGTLDERTPVFPRNAVVMVHELPMMAWAKAGVFMPSFGVYTDDHTGFHRSLFEQDVSKSEDTVLGAEIGFAPNYPYGTISVFTNDATIGGTSDTGWGIAANGGFRDLGWSLTGHAMMKSRGGQGRGDLYGAGIGWGFNPAYYLEDLNLTFIGELSAGHRIVDGQGTTFGAAMVEGQYWLWNGVSLRAKSDLGLLDAGVPGSFQQRYGLGLEVVPIPGFTLTTWGRMLLAQGGGPPSPDLFVQLHGWF